jgi:cytochrome c oxidase subunit 2
MGAFVAHAGGGIVPTGSRAFVFERIFRVFLLLGALVGVVVVAYLLYNASRYRAGRPGDVANLRTLGELPTGGGGGGKLFLSFGLSAVIVVSLVGWTYVTLLYVEQDAPTDQADAIEVEVVGYRFGWEFVYPNGHTTTGTLRVPEGRTVKLVATSRDVFHTFGIPSHNVKTDAIPGRETETWFVPDDPGRYTARCYELCGAGHSAMQATVIVMEPPAYDAWYENTTAGNATTTGDATAGSASLGTVSRP